MCEPGVASESSAFCAILHLQLVRTLAKAIIYSMHLTAPPSSFSLNTTRGGYYMNSTSSLHLVHRMKRSYGNSPSGITPLVKIHGSKQHSSSRGRKRLDFDAQQTLSTSVSSQQPQKFPKWTTEEETLLLEFLSRKCSEGKFTQWPSFPDKLFWQDAAKLVTESSTTHPQSCERTGMYS